MSGSDEKESGAKPQESSTDAPTRRQPWMPKKTEGSVAAIMDKREIVIDIGSSDGVELGSRFVVLGKKALESTPSLEVPFPKTVVKVVRFLEDGHHSIGRTYRIVRGSPGQPGLFSDFLTTNAFRALQQGTPATPDHVERLNVDDEDMFMAGLSTDEKRVRVGDRVQLTLGDEYDEVGG
ncbi:hypothetical protein ACQ7HM_21265 [Williamsia sp. MIQD14]|uniref:hypothetical protein n=1 Tax=Williamsia sp. MIQD14 TaxID=3425703 RepID=UPI003DA0CDEA